MKKIILIAFLSFQWNLISQNISIKLGYNYLTTHSDYIKLHGFVLNVNYNIRSNLSIYTGLELNERFYELGPLLAGQSLGTPSQYKGPVNIQIDQFLYCVPLVISYKLISKKYFFLNLNLGYCMVWDYFYEKARPDYYGITRNENFLASRFGGPVIGIEPKVKIGRKFFIFTNFGYRMLGESQKFVQVGMEYVFNKR